jgi:polyketide biosynthesis enoyl-CoA hydratase PksI
MADGIAITPIEPGIVRLALDAASTHNRLDRSIVEGLLDALAALRSDPALRAVILAGTPEVFCAGASYGSLEELTSGAVNERALFALPSALLEFPCPIVGAIEGHAVGGGLALVLCCDIAIASERARYGFNFVQLGITPGLGVTRLLPLLVGPSLAAEMLLTGRHYLGRDLRALGLFSEVLPAAEVMPRALDDARRIAESPRHVIELLKNTLSSARREALAAAVEPEIRMHEQCFAHPDARARLERWYLS